jgi:predicted nuclease of restriction endonuclease-like (RecB) superfamily
MNEYENAVKIIKQAVEKSRYRAAKAGNAELLSLYYGIGKYVSENTRNGTWGTDAIKRISERLKVELTGIRGFSETNIKYMRIFYEEWCPFVNRQPTADDLEINEEGLLIAIRQPMADEINWNEFMALGFSHHMEILLKTNDKDERLFYIHECATRAWNKYTLRDYIKSGLYQNRENLPNNFDTTIPDVRYAVKATKAFKDNYLLDFINTENLGETSEDIDERIIENQIVNNIKEFIIRFGTDFIFMGNQYRLEAFGEEMFIDLLFFNRELNCLVAVELKAGKFKTSYLGQLNTYLTVLDDKVRKSHENPSVGLILCRDMNKAFVDYVIRDYDKPLGVATYKTYKDMPDNMKKALPDVEDLKQLLMDGSAD